MRPPTHARDLKQAKHNANAYAAEHGNHWKDDLRAVWVGDAITPLLSRLRATYGPPRASNFHFRTDRERTACTASAGFFISRVHEKNLMHNELPDRGAVVGTNDRNQGNVRITLRRVRPHSLSEYQGLPGGPLCICPP